MEKLEKRPRGLRGIEKIRNENRTEKGRKIQDGGGRRFGRSTAREIWNLGKVKFGGKTRETERDRTEQGQKSENWGNSFRLKTGEAYGWKKEKPSEWRLEERKPKESKGKLGSFVRLGRKEKPGKQGGKEEFRAEAKEPEEGSFGKVKDEFGKNRAAGASTILSESTTAICESSPWETTVSHPFPSHFSLLSKHVFRELLFQFSCRLLMDVRIHMRYVSDWN